MDGGFPVNILNTLKTVPEVCGIFCATANPVEVVVAETEQGRGILGVIDGVKTKGIETERRHQGPQRFSAQDRIQAVATFLRPPPSIRFERRQKVKNQAVDPRLTLKYFSPETFAKTRA